MNYLTMALLFASLLMVPQRAYPIAYETPVINKSGQVGLFNLQSAKTLGLGRLSIGIYQNWSNDKAFLVDTVAKPTISISNLYPHVGFGFLKWADFSVMLPIYLESVAGYPSSGFDEQRAGYGDLELALKFQYPPYDHPRLFDMAYFGALSIPTGMSKTAFFPRHTYYYKTPISMLSDTTDSSGIVGYYTSQKMELDMKMLWTVDLSELSGASPVLVHLNYGIRFNFNTDLDHLFLLNLAFEYHPLGWLTLFTEFSGEAKISNFKIGNDPLRLSPGICITPPGGLYLTLGADISVSSDSLLQYYVINGNTSTRYTTGIEPRWRLAGTIGWTGMLTPQDKDHDGINDKNDVCPADPEDKDGFQDQDGCPDLDNDGDGISDIKDKCPNAPEDFDGHKDDDGCPDFDNDGDGIPDSLDKCPSVSEDIDQFQDTDGCPDYDNDFDGIPDTLDKCASQPEDKDGFEDADGCPDLDNDKDGIPDEFDKCPMVPGVKENSGCPALPPPEKPKAKEIKRGNLILKGVNFETGLAVLTPESYSILDEVYESLREWPEIKLEIQGHTDSVGDDRTNLMLSQKRAESVRSYLVSRGIAGDRIIPIGKGETVPIADNKTAQGRAANRRVELHRID